MSLTLNKSISLKPYLDIFGDWYYTKDQTGNKSRALGIDTLSAFFDKYKIEQEKRTATLEQFSNIFGREYLFGSSNDINVCRPKQITDIIPYLKNRIETIKDDIKNYSTFGRSVQLSRLRTISKNMANYVTLMESSNSESLQLCEDIKLSSSIMSDEEMLSYLTKVLYYGLYPKEANDNIKKCITDFRALPENDILKKLIANIKKKDTDGIVSFLKLVSLVATSIPKQQTSDIQTIREHLTFIFDRLSSDVGSNAFKNNEDLLDQLKSALSKISAEDIHNASSQIIPGDFKGLIERLAAENIKYDDRIKDMLELLSKNDFKGFVNAVKSYTQSEPPMEVKRRMDVVMKQLKEEKNAEIAAEIKEQARRAQYQIKKMYENPMIKGEIPLPIDKKMFDIISKLEKELTELKKKDLDVGAFKGRITELETEIKIFGDNINKLKAELVAKNELIEQLKTVDKSSNKLQYIARIFKGIEQSQIVSPENKVIMTEAINILNKEELTPNDIKRLNQLLNEAIIPTVSSEELDNIMNELEAKEVATAYDIKIKDILNAIKLFKLHIEKDKEININNSKSLINEIDNLEKDIRERELLLETKTKEYEDNKKHNYLNVLIALTANPETRSALIKQIANKHTNLSKSDENIMSNLQGELGIPEDIKITDIFDEILNIFEPGKLNDLIKEAENMSKEELHNHLYNLSIIILYLSSALPEGILELEGVPNDMIKTIKLLEGEDKFMHSEKAIAFINDLYYILSLPFKMTDNTLKKDEIINEVPLNKTTINASTNEINRGFNDYDETIRDNLMESNIYSKQQIVSVFITLLKVYYKKKDSPKVNENVSPAGLFGNNKFEEEAHNDKEYANNFEEYIEPQEPEEKYEDNWHNEEYNNSIPAEEVPYNEGVEDRELGEEEEYSKVKYKNFTKKDENVSPAGLFGNNTFEEEPVVNADEKYEDNWHNENKTAVEPAANEEYSNNFEEYVEPEKYNNSLPAEEVPYNEGVEDREVGEEDQLYSKMKFKNFTKKEENVSPAGLFGNNTFEEEPTIKLNTTIDKKRIDLRGLLLNKNPSNQARAYERRRILSAVGCIRGNEDVLNKLCSNIKKLIEKYDEFTIYDDIINAIIDAYIKSNDNQIVCNKLLELYIYEILLAVDYITTKYEVSKGCGIGDDPKLKDNYNKLIEYFMRDEKTFLDHYEMKKPKAPFKIQKRTLKRGKEELVLPNIDAPNSGLTMFYENDNANASTNYNKLFSGQPIIDTGVKTSAASTRKLSVEPIPVRSPFVSGRSGTTGQQDIAHNARILDDAYRKKTPYSDSEFDELHSKLKTRSAKRDFSEIQRTLTYKAKKQGGRKGLTKRNKNNK
jgi:hypothetical protein